MIVYCRLSPTLVGDVVETWIDAGCGIGLSHVMRHDKPHLSNLIVCMDIAA